MSTTSRFPRRRGFVPREVVMALAATALIASLLMIAGSRTRQAGLLGQDMAKLRTMGAATYAFALDNNDDLWTFNWKGGVHYDSPWPELRFSTHDQGAAINQAIHIMRQRSGRLIQRPSSWLPHVLYSHLMLVDYFDEPIPWMTAISAADANRLRWASDPLCFEAGCFNPCGPYPWGAASFPQRWPFSASFQMVPAVWDRSPAGHRTANVNSSYYWYTGSLFGPGRLSDIAFPSRKVLVHDERDRHSGNPVLLHFAHPDARLPVLFGDGRARVKHTADANPGWQPNAPARPLPTRMLTSDEPYCTPGQQLPQMPDYWVDGVYRWTRGGLAGRDFAGPEINTGQRGDADQAQEPWLAPKWLMEVAP
jgi:hypothetical protein